MKKINLLFVFAISSLLFITSCEKDDPEIPNEEEVITTLTYTLTPVGGGTPVVLSFQDLDGDGGNPPIVGVGVFAANTTYTGEISLLNEIESPAENITEEVEEEGAAHQFFFESAGNVTVAYNDVDENGLPVGLSTTLTTFAAESTTMTVTLRHEPAKEASGVSGGDITNAGGESDIEVTFNIDVQ